MKTLLIMAFVLFFPVITHAAVFINEVAWMGTLVSANAEWMELANLGDTSVDLAGWHLLAGNGSPSIALSGSIAAHGYYLLERTNDTSVPNVSADQIYTGALTNSGTTLTLTDGGGTTVDQVEGGANWTSIGGDNASKQTAQRTSSGWETAAGTPRATNAGVSDSHSTPADDTTTPADSTTSHDENVASTTNATGTASSTGGPAEYLPIPTLRILTERNRTISSGADTVFSAVVYDSKGNKRTDAIVTWSFGDGMQRTGTSVFHSYYDPGEYVVVVHARTTDDGDALAESIVVVKDASVHIETLSSRGITLANASNRTLDLSLWRLSMGGKEFKIPPDTQILSGHSVLFPSPVTELPLADSAFLLYPNGEVAAAYPPLPVLTQLAPQPSSSSLSYSERQTVDTITNVKPNIQGHEDAALAPATANELAAAGAALPSAPDKAPDESHGSSLFRSPWTLGLLGVIAVAGGAFILL